MPVTKPSGWADRLDALIREGKNYAETNATLLDEYKEGVKGKAYHAHKNKLFPSEDDVERALEERAVKGEQLKKETKRPKWTPSKQKAADESTLAKLINQGVASFSPCPSKALTLKDVEEINPGGAVVACVQYLIPDLNLDHPVIVLVTRVIVLVLKIRAICFTIKAKAGTMADKLTGVKPEFQEPGTVAKVGDDAHDESGVRLGGGVGQ